MDLSKLTPAPWGVHDGGRDDHTICRENSDDTCQPLFENLAVSSLKVMGQPATEFVTDETSVGFLMVYKSLDELQAECGFVEYFTIKEAEE